MSLSTPSSTTSGQRRPLPLGLSLYRLATRVLGLFADPLLRHRARQGKEVTNRLPERLGHAGAARPDGPLVWLHGASVGETLVLATLVDALIALRPDLTILMTSGTATSARLMAERLPQGAIHQFTPIDRPDVAQRFIAHWQPDLAIFAESELWPNLILEAKASGARLALVNARLSQSSLNRWATWSASAARLLGAFDWIGAADTRTAQGLSTLCDHEVKVIGNLKSAAEPPSADAGELAALGEAIGDRPVWLAASTHPGEDAIVLDAHRQLRTATNADWLLILAPRHPERGGDMAALATDAGFATARRAASEPLTAATSVYVADTLGEMGLWYRLSPTALIGGSLLPSLSGHNPLEPALLGSTILTGPHTSSFETLFDDLVTANGAVRVCNAGELVNEIRQVDAPLRSVRVRSAHSVAMGGANVLNNVLRELTPLLPERHHA